MKSLLFILITSLLFGCADERPVDTLDNDLTKNWREKNLISGNDVSISNVNGLRAESRSQKKWIYKSTVVSTSTNGGWAFVGLQGDSKIGYFKFTEDHLYLYNAIDSQGSDGIDSTPNAEIIWNVEHKDKKLDDSTGQVSNNEIEDRDTPWNQRSYFELGEEITSNFSDRCWSRAASNVVPESFEVSSNYMTFIVRSTYEPSSSCFHGLRRLNQGNSLYTVDMRYSFKKYLPNPSYKPYIYEKGRNDPLLSKYGYFNSYLEYLDHRTGRYGHVYLMNRWDFNKEHTYYFTKNFPEQWKDEMYDIFKKTNELFAANNLKVRFNLRENHAPGEKAKELGDIRYSFVNVVEELTSAAPLGYGPSDADPLTGEIISGNLHMYTGYLNIYLARLKDTFDRKKSKLDDSTLFEKMKRDLKNDDVLSWSKPLEYGKNKPGTIFNKILMEETYAFPLWARFSAFDPNLSDDKIMKKLFNFEAVEDAFAMYSKVERNTSVLNLIDEKNSKFKSLLQNMIQNPANKASHSHIDGDFCEFPVHETLAGAQKLLINGFDTGKIIDTIFYRTAVHELGHNLNLRHNFYGSVDAKNFHPPAKIKDDNGQEREIPSYTASIMDYLNTNEQAFQEYRWEPYDEAALLFAYSDGQIDSKKQFMYCTDEHRVLNAMCATWDYGSTPTEALYSHIESYEDMYNYRNSRNNRGYWDTSGYASSVFEIMWSVKKFLMMYETGYTESLISKELDQIPGLLDFEKKEIRESISYNFQDAIEMAVVFYNAVLEQSSAERDWRTQYEERTGEVKKVGVAADKIFAMQFLAGDSSFMYDPNRSRNHSTYLSYINSSRIGPTVTKIFENAINSRVDMEQGFLGFGRALFALNATNYYNRGNEGLIAKIGLQRFDEENMREIFGLTYESMPADMKRLGMVYTLGKNSHPDFGENETVAVVRLRDYWYMASQKSNPYSFNDMRSIIERQTDVADDKRNLQDLYFFYQQALENL